MIYLNNLVQITLFFLLNCTCFTLARSDATATTTTDHFVTPTLNAVVSAGSPYPIEWIITTESDPSSEGEDYNLTLFMNGEKVRMLDSETNSTAGDNTFVWVPGTALVDSTEYHVKVIYPNLTLTSPRFAVTGGRRSTTTATTSSTTSSSSSSSSSGSPNTQSSSPNTSTTVRTKHHSHVGAIVGGIVGGLLGLACLVGLIWFLCLSKRRRRENGVSKEGMGRNEDRERLGSVNEAYAPELDAGSKIAPTELPVSERPIGELSGHRERAELMGDADGRGLRSELP